MPGWPIIFKKHVVIQLFGGNLEPPKIKQLKMLVLMPEPAQTILLNS